MFCLFYAEAQAAQFNWVVGEWGSSSLACPEAVTYIEFCLRVTSILLPSPQVTELCCVIAPNPQRTPMLTHWCQAIAWQCNLQYLANLVNLRPKTPIMKVLQHRQNSSYLRHEKDDKEDSYPMDDSNCTKKRCLPRQTKKLKTIMFQQVVDVDNRNLYLKAWVLFTRCFSGDLLCFGRNLTTTLKPLPDSAENPSQQRLSSAGIEDCGVFQPPSFSKSILVILERHPVLE